MQSKEEEEDDDEVMWLWNRNSDNKLLYTQVERACRALNHFIACVYLIINNNKDEALIKIS